jgi:hypothetical protein
MRTLFLLALALSPALCGAADVYKWTDEKGRTHYSSSPPPAKATQAKTVDLKNSEPTELDRMAAEERLAKEKESLRPQASPPAPAALPGSLGSPRPPAPPVPKEKSSCEQAWKDYNRSAACFDRHRNAKGTISAEGYSRCKEVVRPIESCR